MPATAGESANNLFPHQNVRDSTTISLVDFRRTLGLHPKDWQDQNRASEKDAKSDADAPDGLGFVAICSSCSGPTNIIARLVHVFSDALSERKGIGSVGGLISVVDKAALQV